MLTGKWYEQPEFKAVLAELAPLAGDAGGRVAVALSDFFLRAQAAIMAFEYPDKPSTKTSAAKVKF
mgnify:CR=1 FL=1